MLNIAFLFHSYKQNDGKQRLLIRMRTRDQEKKISTDIYIDKRKWDNSNKMVRTDHTAYQPINREIQFYQDKIKRIKPLFELGEIDFNTAYLMLTSSGSLDSIEVYMKNFCKRQTAQWHRNTKNALDAFKYHTGLTEEVRFTDITKENILKMKDSIKEKGGQPETHNNYLSHIRAVYNKALKDNMTYREFKFDTDYFEKTDKHSKKLKTVKKVAAETLHKLRDTLEIDRWRDKIQLTGKVKSIIERTLYNLPEKPYPVSEIKTRKDKVYQHIYSSYFGSGKSVYKQSA